MVVVTETLLCVATEQHKQEARPGDCPAAASIQALQLLPSITKQQAAAAHMEVAACWALLHKAAKKPLAAPDQDLLSHMMAEELI